LRDNANISVIVTSALFVDSDGILKDQPVGIRVERLLKTLDFLKPFVFGKIIILDSTITGTHESLTSIALTYNAQIYTAKRNLIAVENEYQIYGPSRLEIDLIHSSADFLKKELKPDGFVIKLSAGYVIKNLDQLLAKTAHGIVFRFGNPARMKIRFCLSCFYLMPTATFLKFDAYCFENLANVAKLKPLESHLYDFIKTIETNAISISYPDVEAKFLSSNQSSADFNHQLKQKVYSILSLLGLYAFEVR
jgi:hypothetical protein